VVAAALAIGAIVAPTQASAFRLSYGSLVGPNQAPAAAAVQPSADAAPSSQVRVVCTPRSWPPVCHSIASATPSAASSAEFQLGDAAIGAGVVAGLGLLGLAGIRAARRAHLPLH
jgi:hypothetical protein